MLLLAVVIVAVFALLIGTRSTGRATTGFDPYHVPVVSDTNPDPDIVETTIVAEEATVDVGNGVMAHALTFNGTIPGPEFRLKVGDTVIVHFENHLDDVTGIHWHGIELNNQSDGTPVTQNQVPAGGTHLYKLQITRPGMFWYHPHHHASTNQVFKGLIGTIIVTDPNESALIADGVIPPASDALTLALSDTTVCKEPGQNDTVTFDPSLPWVGGSQLPANLGPTPAKLCDTPIDDEGESLGTPLEAGDIPNVDPSPKATVGPFVEGQTVLTNGMNVGGRAGDPANPEDLAAGAQTLDAKAGQGLRMRIGGEATTRFFRLRLTDNEGRQIPLVRIGGQGGLLDNAVVEGGVTPDGFDFKYDRGELLVDSGDRDDVVAAIPADATGVLTLWTEDFARTGQGFAKIPTVPVMHLRVNGTADTAYTISDGTPLRAATGDLVPELGAPTGGLLDPTAFQKNGMLDPDIKLTGTGSSLGVNGVQGSHDIMGDYASAPHPNSTRYAKLGDSAFGHEHDRCAPSVPPARLLDPADQPHEVWVARVCLPVPRVPGQHRRAGGLHAPLPGSARGPTADRRRDARRRPGTVGLPLPHLLPRKLRDDLRVRRGGSGRQRTAVR